MTVINSKSRRRQGVEQNIDRRENRKELNACRTKSNVSNVSNTGRNREKNRKERIGTIRKKGEMGTRT